MVSKNKTWSHFSYHKKYNIENYCSAHNGDIPARHTSKTCHTLSCNHIWNADRANYHIVGGTHTNMQKDIFWDLMLEQDLPKIFFYKIDKKII